VVDVDVAVRTRGWQDAMRNLMRRRSSELHNVVRWAMYLIEYVLCSETNRWMSDSSMEGRCGVVDVLLLGVMQVQLYGCVALRLRWGRREGSRPKGERAGLLIIPALNDPHHPPADAT